MAWPEAVLDWPECAEVSHMDTAGMQTLVWRGLRARIGIAYGCPQYRKPLNTGAAHCSAVGAAHHSPAPACTVA